MFWGFVDVPAARVRVRCLYWCVRVYVVCLFVVIWHTHAYVLGVDVVVQCNFVESLDLCCFGRCRTLFLSV
jgi:hypothetical protein